MRRMRTVEVVPYDPAWPDRAHAEIIPLRPILGDLLVRIEHVGSTSVPGLAAKPVIDLLPLVTDITLVDPLQPQFEAAGYVWYGEYRLPGRRYVNIDDPLTGLRRANIHIYAESDPEVARHLAFPAYLRARPDLRDEYGALKQACSRRFPADIEGYMDCKDAWIQRVQAEAEAWWRGRTG